MLPVVQLPKGEFRLDDTTVMPIRGLSRAEALQLRMLRTDIEAIEILCIKAATGCNEDEAKAWHSTTPNQVVERLVNDVASLSGLNEDEGKDGAESLHSANVIELTTSLQKILDLLSDKSEVLQAPK